jgi:hypothetical protein
MNMQANDTYMNRKMPVKRINGEDAGVIKRVKINEKNSKSNKTSTPEHIACMTFRNSTCKSSIGSLLKIKRI